METLSRCVSSCSALYCATTALMISLPMDGRTRSSQSSPRFCASSLELAHSKCAAGSERGPLQSLEAMQVTQELPAHLEDGGQGVCVRLGQDSEGNVDHLQICTPPNKAGVSQGTSASRPTCHRCSRGLPWPLALREGIVLCKQEPALSMRPQQNTRQLTLFDLTPRPLVGVALPFVPVTELIVRGRVRMSMTLGDCSQGTRKCVPSPTGAGNTPCIRSYMTARSPPSTAQAGTPFQCRLEAIWT